MNKNPFRAAVLLLPVFFALVVPSREAVAGPPLVCHPIQIGNARSLPGGSGPFGIKSDYNRGKLVEETLELLNPEMPVLVRMETLRRATLYASGIYRGDNAWKNQSEEDRRIAFELLSRLMARALQTAENANSMARFDVGYLMACYEQANIAKDLSGYELVKKSLVVSGQNPEIEFACAMITVWPKNSAHSQHLQKARAAAKTNPLLAANIESHFTNEKAQ
jgi:hypothetical protein